MRKRKNCKNRERGNRSQTKSDIGKGATEREERKKNRGTEGGTSQRPSNRDEWGDGHVLKRENISKEAKGGPHCITKRVRTRKSLPPIKGPSTQLHQGSNSAAGRRERGPKKRKGSVNMKKNEV